MQVTDELLLALADGELDAETAAHLRESIAADPQLQADYAIFTESARWVREALDPGPTPERLIAAIKAVPVSETATVAEAIARDQMMSRSTRLRIASAQVIRQAASRLSVSWGAIAASLLLGVGIGSYASRSDQPEGGQDVLGYANLPTGTEAQTADGINVRVLGSYRTDDGLCRDILTETKNDERHDLICKANGEWHLAFSISAPAADGFTPASDALTASIDGYLTAIGAGSALSRAEEEEALSSP